MAKTYETPSPQEAFELVARHLFTQGKPAVKVNRRRNGDGDFDHMCLYRAPGGLRCAVGALIPDALYRKAMENKNVSRITGMTDLEDDANFKPLIFLRPIAPMLGQLQGIHDDGRMDEHGNWIAYNFSTSQKMRDALDYVGQSFGLDTGFLKALSFADGR